MPSRALTTDMRFSRHLLAVGVAVIAPIVAGLAQPAVQPGGDIPPHSVRRAQPPIRTGPQTVTASPSSFLYTRREAMVRMRDGTRLYTLLILPRGVSSKVPILLDRTPYSAEKTAARGYGPWPENILPPLYAELVRAGYGLAFQDVRGKHRSEGDYVVNRPLRGPLNGSATDHSTDAWDTIDWLVKSVPESNGKVATIGSSYDGFTALMSLVDSHPALRAAVPINPMVDGWKGDDWFHNGAFRQEMLAYVFNQTSARESDESWFTAKGDNYDNFLRLGSAARYARETGIDALPFWQRLASHPAYDEYWQQQAMDRILAAHPPRVPMLVVASLWDQEDIYGATALFAALKRTGAPIKLTLGPWNHGGANLPAMALGPLQFGNDTARWFRANVLIPFLDQHLKGSPDPRLARVTAYEVGGRGWRSLDDWPVACAANCASALSALHLAPGRKLTFSTPGESGEDSFVSDPSKPVPYRARPILSPWAPGSTWRLWLIDDQRFAAARDDVLTYTGEPLSEPLRLAGAPTVNLRAATDGSDSDWVVKLIDVYPDRVPGRPALSGYQFPIAMNIVRGRYNADPTRATPLRPGQLTSYSFALPDVSYVVQPGHRLMVQIQSSWFPLYDRNPQTFVPSIFTARKSDYRIARQRIAFGPGGSWIGLPVVR
jgi:putative CocE/NonD family hydrolase